MLDMLIKNARIIDGTGAQEHTGDVACAAGRIVQAGGTCDSEAHRVIDCGGRLAVSPGFVDVHGHSDFFIFEDSRLLPKLRQGITTDISCNCGLAPAPVSTRWFETNRDYVQPLASGIDMPDNWREFTTFGLFQQGVERCRPGINAGYLAAHGTIRIAVMGFEDSNPTPAQLGGMKDLVREAMQSGALGLSSGLIYMPGMFAKKDELIELCKIVGEYGGVYATHMRSEGRGVLDALAEAIDIARQAECRLNISHIKVIGARNKELVDRMTDMIEAARADGMGITADQYPYRDGCTFLNSIIPSRFLQAGVPALCEMLRDKAVRADIEREINEASDPQWQNFAYECGWDGIRVCTAGVTRELIGRSVADIARERGARPFDTACDLLIENGGDVLSLYSFVDEETIEKFMQLPYVMAGTDGNIFDNHHNPHPRAHGTFTRVLGRYVRERGVLPLTEAVRKLTLLPAETFGLAGKGRIAEGYDADLVVFDPDTIMDGATFEDTSLPNTGIHYVIVGGGVAVEHDKPTNEGRGRVVRRGQE